MDAYNRLPDFSDDDYDDEGFSFHDEVKIPRHKRAHHQTQSKQEAQENRTNRSCVEEERDVQFKIMDACMSGDVDTVNEYLERHDPNDFLISGWTPLLYAASSAQAEVVELLLASGANPNRHKDGFTPLMALCNTNTGTISGYLKCLELLIGTGADVDMANKYNETALMLACKGSKPELIVELLKHVDNINFTDSESQTALFYAVIANRPDVVKILLENNADITIKDKHDYTAKDIAVTKSYEKVSALLSSQGDDLFEPTEVSEKVETYTWRDMFPMLRAKREKYANFDIAIILYGMGMERYKSLFEGIDLKAFLKLTEEDLIKIGVDMPFHRKQFLEGLHKFHVKSWSTQSIGAIRKSLPYTIYDGVVSLGNAAKQIGVISSSIRFVKNSLVGAKEKNLKLSDQDKVKYSGELQKTQESLLFLEKELKYMKTLAKRINKDTKLDPPADYIGPKKRKSNWTIILSVSLIIGIYLSRTPYVRRIWTE